MEQKYNKFKNIVFTFLGIFKKFWKSEFECIMRNLSIKIGWVWLKSHPVLKFTTKFCTD